MTPVDLTAGEVTALHEALEDEYKAWATYDQVIQDFGAVRPFVNIRESEARHVAALAALYERFALPMPRNDWPGRALRFENLRAACEAAVAGEVENELMYRRLLAATSTPIIRRVFERLRDASQQRHLPAFRRCLARQSANLPMRSGRRHCARGRA